jgi:hypothetical protein
VCTSKILRRALFFKKHFPKVRSYKNLFSSLLKKSIMQKGLWFQKFKTNFKRDFVFKKHKQFQVASLYCKKRKRFFFHKKKAPSKGFCFKNPCLKKKSFPN